ncbi:transcription/translation regulatory transformer protein RfaH [Craterilacuibacter sp. RT1T]|uniref:transcription/translation regulatory transformer protein RfaH n=1 Tax=Craterilacuibacter sp. RT1T TaxID=2942211 RepID=UPI0020BE6930|nr:transcription/translation regulatory transformer protein RfaH [Craterilacuibacter sp. RT1T]MCL6263658.1 transcription/translation regulatory transformer protein RfaH [Craterilacuibacter sp. RT1T]
MPLPPPPQQAWYLIHTKPRQEDKALLNLEQQGYQCYLPRCDIEKIHRGKTLVVSEALFPRYLFIRLGSGHEGKSWAPIRSTLGVSTLVQFGGQPAKVDDALIEALHQHEQASPHTALFSPGEIVRITDGPFIGLDAIYQCCDAEQRSLILLELLHKQVRMQIETARLGKIG